MCIQIPLKFYMRNQGMEYPPVPLQMTWKLAKAPNIFVPKKIFTTPPPPPHLPTYDEEIFPGFISID